MVCTRPAEKSRMWRTADAVHLDVRDLEPPDQWSRFCRPSTAARSIPPLSLISIVSLSSFIRSSTIGDGVTKLSSRRAEARTVRMGSCFAWCAGVHEHRGNLSRRRKEPVIAAIDPISVLRSGGRLSRLDVAGAAHRRGRGCRFPRWPWLRARGHTPPRLGHPGNDGDWRSRSTPARCNAAHAPRRLADQIGFLAYCTWDDCADRRHVYRANKHSHCGRRYNDRRLAPVLLAPRRQSAPRQQSSCGRCLWLGGTWQLLFWWSCSA